jgi:hypothetical protein
MEYDDYEITMAIQCVHLGINIKKGYKLKLDIIVHKIKRYEKHIVAIIESKYYNANHFQIIKDYYKI